MEFRHIQLGNGLTIVAEVNPQAASMAAGFFVRTGSRDETPGVAGVSHFLEHMMFKGTPRRSALDVNREFDEIGASYNAYTSQETTAYFGGVLPEFQDRLLDLLCDLLRPSLRAEDFELERTVILDEIARYEDVPSFRLYDMLLAEHFLPHPLGTSVLGTKESIANLRVQDMRRYFQQRYSPGNLVLAGAGKVDFAALTAAAERLCGGWTPVEVGRDTSRPAVGRRRKVAVDKDLVREQLGLASPAPSAQDAQRYAALLATAVMGDATGSRLYYSLVDPAIADEASMALDSLDGTGAFLTYLTVDPDRAGEAMDIAQRELRKFLDAGPTAAELTAAKNKIASASVLKGEAPMERLGAVALDWLYRHEYMPLERQIEELFAVTAEQVLEVSRQYDLLATTVAALGPVEKL
jgi:predicted Zn-dependent peptidase